ncbi:MAG: sulfite exporter TauE/SafE family protein [Bacteroidetes bacterium]|nr:sulfite exporter TauE/SafE family protein [Bacteroidota bacterium]
MLSLFITAWLMGFIGSAHCIGMCGPLALAIPMQSGSILERLFNSLLYNVGRIVTYTLYGSLLGLAHSVIIPYNLQAKLAIAIGIILMCIGLFILFSNQSINMLSGQARFYQVITKKIGLLFRNPSQYKVFLIGILNGLLPCGLVYLALATAFASGSVAHSMIYMAAFGLGTLPAMWSIVFFANSITPSLRMRLRKLYPFVYLATGIFLIWRGSQNYNPLRHMQHGDMIFCF